MSGRWPRHRVFRLGLLIGRGFRADEIANDPIVDAKPGEIHGAARKYGFALSHGTTARLVIEMDRKALDCLIEEARRRRTQSDALAARILGRTLADPNLFANASGD